MALLETRVPINLGGQERLLFINANTFAAYEEATGKFFLDTAASLYDAMKPFLESRREAKKALQKGETVSNEEAAASAFSVLRKVSIRDLRALLWAAIHEYDEDGEPHWPLTLTEVGRQLKLTEIPQIFMAFMKGQISNSPSTEEVGESPAAPVNRPVKGAPPKKADGGGERSTELPQDAFDFATPTSGS